jgi:hypothetical protein
MGTSFRGDCLAKGDMLGIIGCSVLQDELIYVLNKDTELKRIHVIESDTSKRFVERARLKLPNLEIGTVSFAEIHDLRKEEGFGILLEMKTTSLHRDPDAFRNEVILTCRNMKPHVDGVLLFYGLCRNALRKMHKVSEDVGIPVTLLKDSSGQDIDDCFGALMGGRESYLFHMREHRGTMFIIPGYAEMWYNKLTSKDVEKALEAYQNLKFVFDRCGYTKLLRMDTHLCDQKEFEHRVETFARLFDMQLSAEEANLSVFDSSYAKAKLMARGSLPVEDSPPDVKIIQPQFVPF